MTLSLEISDTIARHLQLEGPDRFRRALEMMALEGYREGSLSRGLVSEMLGQSFHETEAFLHQHGAFLDIDVATYERSAEALQRLLAQ